MAARSSPAGDAGVIAKPSLTLKRRLKAEPEQVYAAWIDPQKIARWFAPASARAGSGHAVIEARVGGRFRVGFVLENGENFEVGGIYRELVPNRRLVFSWAWHTTPERESLVTVSLQGDRDGTLLTLHHEQLFDQAACDSHERGWNNALDKLDKLVA